MPTQAITAEGLVKKTEFTAYNTPIRADGIIAIKIRDKDELVQVRLTSGDDDILLVSKSGHASRFSESKVRAMGRDTSGVKGMNVSAKVNGVANRVLAMDIARDDSELFVVTENGYGKRTSIEDYPAYGRGGQGVISIQTTARNGAVVGAVLVNEQDEIMLISNAGTLVRTRVVEVSMMGRNTQGVKLIALGEDEQLVGMERIVEDGEGGEDDDEPPTAD